MGLVRGFFASHKVCDTLFPILNITAMSSGLQESEWNNGIIKKSVLECEHDT